MYPTIKIYVEGGVVQEVDNLPDGFQYEVIDKDICIDETVPHNDIREANNDTTNK
jgi:hypothetical protein